MDAQTAPTLTRSPNGEAPVPSTAEAGSIRYDGTSRARKLLSLYLAAEMTQLGVPLSELGIPSPWLLATGLGVLAIVAGLFISNRRPPVSILYVALAAFVWSRALSVLGALDPRLSDGPLSQLLKDSLTVIVVVTLGVWSGRRIARSMHLVVVAVAMITALAVLQQFVVGTANEFLGFSLVRNDIDIGASTVRFQGPTSDPNFWARVLVALVPFAIATIAVHRGLARAFFAGCTLSMLLGIYLTQSRGGFVAAGLTVVVVLAIAGGKTRRLLLTAPVLVGLLLVNPATGPRLATLVDLTKESEEVTDLSLAYREAAQRGGLQMFRDHPVTGVGFGNFDAALLPYLRNGVAELPPTAKFAEIAPHNTYLQMAAESGIIGLGGFLLVLGTAGALAAVAAARAHRIPRNDPDAKHLRWFTTALVGSIFGWAFMSISLHENQLRTLFAMFGLAAAAAQVTKSLPQGRRRARLPWTVVRNEVARTTVAAAVSAGAVLLIPVRSEAWVRNVTMLVEVNEPAEDRYIYLQNFAVHSVSWRRTLAEITTSERVKSRLASDIGEHSSTLRLRATARRFNSSIEYRFGGPNPETLDLLTVAVNQRITDAVDELDVPFRLRPLPAGPAERVTRVSSILVSFAVVLPLLLIAQSWGQLAARRRRFSQTYSRFRASLEAQREAGPQ